jgi:hypothetical protein
VETMRKVILAVELKPEEASVTGVRRKLRLKARQIDADFGVRPVREERGEYAVRVDADVAQRLRGEDQRSDDHAGVRVALVH